MGKHFTTHGHAQKGRISPEYYVWQNMKARCNIPSATDYKHYGGRGITICPQWIESFETFLTDMGPRPPGMTLDRRENDGNYCPENCRWATRKQQQNNRRVNRALTINLMTLNAAGWAELVGEHASNIHRRLRRGWSNLEAVFGRVA